MSAAFFLMRGYHTFITEKKQALVSFYAINLGGMGLKKKDCRTEKRSEKILDALSRNLDLPQDAVSGYAHIELSGNREAIIEGCRGVLEYSDCAIALNTGRQTVRICGCELTVVSMQNGQAVIKGVITSILL